MFNVRFLMLSSLFLFILGKATAQELKAGVIVQRIKDHVTCEWKNETVDTYKTGGPDIKVSGIATTFLATLDVLKRAKAKGLNMIITHEPTFYNHFDETEPYLGDPVYRAKMKFIEDNNLVIFRFHDHWHRTEPDGIYKAFIEKIGWQNYQIEQTIYEIPKTNLNQLSLEIQNTFGIKTMRVIGNPDLEINTVALRPGAYGSLSHIELLQNPDVDVIIIGETREWESVEYVRDAISAGMNKAMILMGHAISEEDGMDYCADWVKSFISEIPVEFVPAKEPFWKPEE